MPAGRFAPSPSGSLHLGNLRTALIAWCVARTRGARFVLRMEDLTTGHRPSTEAEQIRDLASLGIDFDGETIRQSERTAVYDRVVGQLSDGGLTYECYCSRREIREATAAPHGPLGRYPGTCASLDAAERVERRRNMALHGRAPALRLRADGAVVDFADRLHGHRSAPVDDFVIRRGDGLAAYNLAVVVDDAESGVDHVVRGDDLLDSTPRQVLLLRLLGLPVPEYIHVPLVLGPDGERLSKRHGAVGLVEQLAAGADVGRVRALLAHSLGIGLTRSTLDPDELLHDFDLDSLPLEPWILNPAELPW